MEQKIYHRVTSVLGHFVTSEMMTIALNIGKVEWNKRSRVAIRIGTRVDNLVCDDCIGKGYKIRKNDLPEVKSCMVAWELWKDRYNPKFISVQDELMDHDAMVIGHRDIRCVVDNVRLTLDIKTSKAIYSDYWLQVCKYAHMANMARKEGEVDSDDAGILRLDKYVGNYEYKLASHPEIDLTIDEGAYAFEHRYNAYVDSLRLMEE